MNLNDLDHFWSGDVSAGVTGDLLPCSGTTRGQQRVLRRLLTNPGDYIAHPEYGAGLPQWVGRPLDAGKVAAVIRSHMLLEESVAKLPAPQITVSQLQADPTGFTVAIAYNDAAAGGPVVLSFNVSA